jgi:cysteine desulfurase/selenocysteine lyase
VTRLADELRAAVTLRPMGSPPVAPVNGADALQALVPGLRAREFPWTAATVYLNNAAVGPIPERTRLALEAFNARRAAPHLLPDADLFPVLDAARGAAARLINAEPGEIALMPNTSAGLNVAARALPLAAGDIVLLSDREFPANVYPWLALRRHGVVVERAPVTPDGFPDEDYLVERLADPRVRALTVSFVQFSNGWKADLGRLGSACRANGAWLVVDAIQGLGASPLDVRALPVDLLACGGQKWLLSPWGSGFLYVRRELIAQLEPAAVGWLSLEGTDDFANLLRYSDRLRPDARRFELPNAFHDHLGLATSIGLLLELGGEAVDAYTRRLGEPLLAWAREREVRVVSPPEGPHRSAIVCVAPPEPQQGHRRLRQAGIVCSLREGSLRFAPHCYNTVAEVEKAVGVLDELVEDPR